MNSRFIGRSGEYAVQQRLHRFGWLPRKDEPDEGYDFNVEIPASNFRPAERILVQVKTAGRQKVNRSGDWLVSIDRSALQRYRRSRHPVFLIAVEQSTEEMRWLDLLHAVQSMPDRTRFAVPAKNTLGGARDDALLAAVRAASASCDARYVSPVNLLDQRSADLAALDPRLIVKGSVIDGQECYSLSAQTDVTIGIFVKSDPRDAPALRALFEFGVAGSVRLESLRIDGSPLFERIAQRAVRFEGTGTERTVRFRLSSAGATNVGSSLDMSGTLTTGTAGARVVLQEACLPLSITLLIRDKEGRIDATWKFESKAWNGKPLQRLPFLAPLLRFVTALEECPELAIAIEHHGEFLQLATARRCAEMTTYVGDLARYLRLVQDLSTICAWLNTPATWSPEVLADDDSQGDWGLYVQLIEGQTISRPSLRISFEPKDDEARRAVVAAVKNSNVESILNLPFVLRNTVLGHIPIRIRMHGYEVQPLDCGSMQLVPGPSSNALLSLSDIRPSEAPNP